MICFIFRWRRWSELETKQEVEPLTTVQEDELPPPPPPQKKCEEMTSETTGSKDTDELETAIKQEVTSEVIGEIYTSTNVSDKEVFTWFFFSIMLVSFNSQDFIRARLWNTTCLTPE